MPPYNINLSPVKVISFVEVPLFHVNPVQPVESIPHFSIFPSSPAIPFPVVEPWSGPTPTYL